MKHLLLPLVLLISLAACSASPPAVVLVPPMAPPTNPTGVTSVANNVCDAYRVISWAIPLVEKLAGSGKLAAVGQQLLTDAKQLVDAGCVKSNATVNQRLIDVASALVAILYQTV